MRSSCSAARETWADGLAAFSTTQAALDPRSTRARPALDWSRPEALRSVNLAGKTWTGRPTSGSGSSPIRGQLALTDVPCCAQRLPCAGQDEGAAPWFLRGYRDGDGAFVHGYDPSRIPGGMDDRVANGVALPRG